MPFAKTKGDFKKAKKPVMFLHELVDRINKKTKIKKEILYDVLDAMGPSILELVCEINELNTPIHFGTGVKFMLVKRWSPFDRRSVVGVTSSITNNHFKKQFKELRDNNYPEVKKLVN